MILLKKTTTRKPQAGAIQNYQILDATPDRSLSKLTALVAQLCDAPICVISIVEEKRQWFKSRFGLNVSQSSRKNPFGLQLPDNGEMLIIPNCDRDPRFDGKIVIPGGDAIRFFAGTPLLTQDGQMLGALCVMDTVSRGLTKLQMETLQVTSQQVIYHLELRRQSQTMAANESRLRIALDAAQMGPFEWDLRDDTISQYENSDRILGFAPNEFDGSFQMFAERVHPDDLEPLKATLQAAMIYRSPAVYEFRVIDSSGEIRWVSGQGEYSFNEDGTPIFLSGVILDVTKRKHEELRAQRMNGVQAFLGEVNQAITREASNNELLEISCRTAVEKGGYQMAWIGLRKSVRAPLRMEAFAGGNDSIRQGIEEYLDLEQASAAKSSLEVFRDQSQLVCHDLGEPVGPAAWRSAAQGQGYQSMVAFPIRVEGEILGVFTIYSKEQESFLDEELRLLDELAIDISFALEIRKRDREKLHFTEALKESAAKLSDAMKIARLAHWEYNLEKDHFHFNDHFYDLLRTTAEEQGGYFLSPDEYAERFLPEEERDTVRSEMTKALQSEDLSYNVQLEHKVLLGDGLEGYFSVRVFAEKDHTGRTVRYHGVNQDITERKLAEDAATKAQRRFRALIEHSSDIILLVDRDGSIIYSSPAVQAVEGYSSEELTFQNYLDNVHPEDVQAVKDTKEKMLENPDKPFPVTWRRQHKNGNWLWLEGVSINLLDDPAVGAIVTNYRDITGRRQLEDDLRQAQKMEAIGRLAGGVAHDFNNLLTVINGYGTLLINDEPDAERTKEAGTLIVQAAERASSLTRQLLAFSRRQVIQAKDLNLNENVSNIAMMLKRILGEDVQLDLHESSAKLWVHADPGMLDQILLNLAVNARDAMPEGGKLTIETKTRELTAKDLESLPDCVPGDYASLRVTDTGCGISEENMSRIFEPFFTTKDPGKGTGLGLATVFGIVNQHKGTVQVESEVDVGTTFDILIPIIEHEEKEEGPTAGGDRQVAIGGKEKILLVEDEQPVRLLVRNVLERAGYEILEASNGEEALEVWESAGGDIDLLFTDIVMPGGISGLDLSNQIRQRCPDLRAIFTSGYSADIAGQELSLRPGENFVQKPIPIYQLLKTVRNCFDEDGVVLPS